MPFRILHQYNRFILNRKINKRRIDIQGYANFFIKIHLDYNGYFEKKKIKALCIKKKSTAN